MGTKASRVKSTKVQAVEEGTCKDVKDRPVVAPPAHKQTASAPPTPLHPEGTPRALNSEFCGPSLQTEGLSVTMTEAWMANSTPKESSLRSGAKAENAQSPDQGYPASDSTATTEAPSNTSSEAPQPVVDIEPPQRSLPPTPEAASTPAAASSDNSLDLPLEEVLKQATEAFGTQIASALSSTKWDRRVQALKGVTTVLKGLDMKVGSSLPSVNGDSIRGLQLRDHSRCFHASCLILHIVMKDKVLPVLLAAHELYKVTFEHGRAAVSEEEASSAASALFPHILAKLGELNIRLHESACDCVIFTAAQPFVGVPLVLTRLCDVLEGRGPHQASALRGQQKMRVHYGVMQAVEMLIRKMPGRQEGEGDEADARSTWTGAAVCPFIVSGLQADSVTGLRVQQAALGLAITVFTTLGKAPLVPLLEQLSPAAKEMLVSRLEEEGHDLEDMDGDGDEEGFELTGADSLCIMGVGLRPHPTSSVSKPITTDGEECLMDEILEDAGLVFDGQALGKKQAVKSELEQELQNLDLNGLID